MKSTLLNPKKAKRPNEFVHTLNGLRLGLLAARWWRILEKIIQQGGGMAAFVRA